MAGRHHAEPLPGRRSTMRLGRLEVGDLRCRSRLALLFGRGAGVEVVEAGLALDDQRLEHHHAEDRHEQGDGGEGADAAELVAEAERARPRRPIRPARRLDLADRDDLGGAGRARAGGADAGRPARSRASAAWAGLIAAPPTGSASRSAARRRALSARGFARDLGRRSASSRPA